MAKVTAADGHEYDKSATANATTAPTNQATIEKAQQNHLSRDEKDFVTVVDYEWNLKGNLTPDIVIKEYGFDRDDYIRLANTPAVIQALNERGISPRIYWIGGKGQKLPVERAKISPIQLLAANAILDLTDTKTNKKKLQDLGVTTKQFNAWMRDPDFTGYLQSRAESLLGDSQHEALLALLDKVRMGDVKAIELYLEMTGRFVKQSASSQQGPDLQTVLIRVVEIITEEVHDKETAFRISERLRGLVNGAAVAGVISLNSPAVGEQTITPPEIAKARKMTPEVHALMEKGVGYDG